MAKPNTTQAANPAPQADAKGQDTGPHAVPGATLKGVGPKYVWKPEARKGSTATVRLTPAGKALGANAKKPGSKTRARWEAFLGAMEAKGGTLSVDEARKYQSGADLAWEVARGRIEYVSPKE